MFLQKSMDVLQNKFPVNVAVINDHQDAEQNNDETNGNNESMQKILKQCDYVKNHYKEDDYLVKPLPPPRPLQKSILAQERSNCVKLTGYVRLGMKRLWLNFQPSILIFG